MLLLIVNFRKWPRTSFYYLDSRGLDTVKLAGAVNKILIIKYDITILILIKILTIKFYDQYFIDSSNG